MTVRKKYLIESIGFTTYNNRTMGKVYLVGAGPGDLKLITLKGLELIQQADCIIYDYLANKELLGFAREDAEIIYAGKQASQHELPQDEINELLLKKAERYSIVVRLKGGDPFIFGRGGEEALFLAEKGIDFEICPGVTSAISVPAYAGIPLTHRHYASSVAFVTGHEDESKTSSSINWKGLATGVDTLVFLMGIRNIGLIKNRLIENGIDPKTDACIIMHGTLPNQRVIVSSLDEIHKEAEKQGAKPPGIIVVGRVVELRDRLRWFEKRPLFGKKIAVTRARHQSTKLGRSLSDRGADILYIPVIDIKTIEPNERLDEAIKSIDRYYAVIFTSTNSVDIFFDALFKAKRDVRSLKGVRVISIGDATASALLSRGVISDFVPEKWTSEGIIEILKGIDIRNKRLLLPRAEEARDILVNYINNNGGMCDVIPIYKTTIPETLEKLKETPDVITFTSSSTVKNFIASYGKQALERCIVASIGPITSKTLRDYGIDATIEAKRYDIPGLVEAIEGYYKNSAQ
ncbi:MAG TPA: uroporphyrinogen-III C-methyltransferase [Syntrophorhabdaceae bacterium]|nr:uroporphyrinogen-III C-methyltransferase [Syntrophorhabdaceae bacterium]